MPKHAVPITIRPSTGLPSSFFAASSTFLALSVMKPLDAAFIKYGQRNASTNRLFYAELAAMNYQLMTIWLAHQLAHPAHRPSIPAAACTSISISNKSKAKREQYGSHLAFLMYSDITYCSPFDRMIRLPVS